MTEMYTPDLFDEKRRDRNLTPRRRARRSAAKIKKDRRHFRAAKFIVCSSDKYLSKVEKMFSICHGRITGGYLYIIEYGANVKIGVAANPLDRIRQLKNMANNYSLVELGRIAVSYPHKKYRENEARLHSAFQNERIRTGELFSARFQSVLEVAENLDIDTTGIDRAERRKHFEDLIGAPVGSAGRADDCDGAGARACRLSGVRTKERGLRHA